MANYSSATCQDANALALAALAAAVVRLHPVAVPPHPNCKSPCPLPHKPPAYLKSSWKLNVSLCIIPSLMPRCSYVGNLSWNTNKDILIEAFSRHGKVLDAFISMDR